MMAHALRILNVDDGPGFPGAWRTCIEYMKSYLPGKGDMTGLTFSCYHRIAVINEFKNPKLRRLGNVGKWGDHDNREFHAKDQPEMLPLRHFKWVS